MRTSKDEYINPLGKLIQLSQSESSLEFIKANGLKLWNGYDYERQCWVHNGERDTRTLEELQESTRAQAKALAISDIGLTEDEAELAVEEFGSFV